MAHDPSPRRDRVIVATGLVVVAALAWAWLVPAALDMYGGMDGPSAWMMQAHWDLRYGVLIFLMWAVMMVGMMLPSAVPTMLRFAGNGDEGGRSASARAARAYASAAGYLLAWTAFGAVATLLQWGLTELRLLSPMMEAASPWLAAAILIAAGVYQWTPLKRASLAYCHAPPAFSRSSRPGVFGALRAGIEYGITCIGCCWALMLLLFAGGVMSLPVIASITVLVLLEKVLPRGALVGRLAGVVLVAMGVWVLLS